MALQARAIQHGTQENRITVVLMAKIVDNFLGEEQGGMISSAREHSFQQDILLIFSVVFVSQILYLPVPLVH